MQWLEGLDPDLVITFSMVGAFVVAVIYIGLEVYDVYWKEDGDAES